jgi:hypothetical protein
MQPTHLIEKISFMRAHQLETVSSAINQRLRMRLAECISIIRPPASVISMLAIDLAYATYRHWRWADTDIFAEIYVDYLCNEYGLERGFAEIAHYEACQLAVSPDSHSESPGVRADLFLRYVLISTIAHRDPLSMADEMGFGEHFFRKLLASIDDLDSAKGSGEQWNFPDPISQRIQRQISEVARISAESPRSLSAELVRFRVYEYNRDITTLPTVAYGRMIIDILGSLSNEQATFELSLPAPQAGEASERRGQLDDLVLVNGGWDALVRAQLVFQVGQRRKGGALPFALTDYSEWLLALSCGPAWLEKNSVSLDAIVALPKYMQGEVIRSLPKKNIPLLVQLLTERVNACQPTALIAAVEQISKFTTPDRVSALVHCSLKLCKNSWSRAALCRCLASNSASNIGQILKEVADSDESLAVRDAALGALLAMTQSQVS